MKTKHKYSLIVTTLALLASLPLKAQQEKDEDAITATGDEVLEVPVEVEAQKINAQPGHTRYDRETIQAMPTGDGHLSDLLRLHPSVDFAREGDLSANSAVMRPGEISIHGQEFYQNLFLIDGIDTSNDLNPADVTDIWATPSLVAPHGGSSPQGYFLDADLLESVEVYDSNVPAEYGGFTGGVISAKLKSYDGKDQYKFRYGLKRDEWEEFHVDEEEDIRANDYYQAAYTPNYIKRNFGLSMRQGITDTLGLTLSASRRLSSFAQRYEKRYHIDRRVFQSLEYEDRIDNVLGRLDWSGWKENKAGLSFRYANRRHDGLTSTTYDGSFEKDHQGYGLTADFEGALGPGRLDVSLGFDELADELDSDSNIFTFHEYAEGSATESQYEGAFGDSEQRQRRFALKPKYTLDARQLGETRHQISVGGELRYTRSFYKRPSDITFMQYFCQSDAGGRRGRTGCNDRDGDGVSSAGDEYLYRLSNYYAGKVDLTYNEVAFHIEDRITIDRWQLTPGLRVDRNNFLDNTDVAPRFSMEWDVFGNDRSRMIAGVNRYYGRNFLRYKLNDAIYGWQDRTQYRTNGEVLRVTEFDNRTGAADLDTPYSDEWMIGWTQALGGLTAKLQYVDREGKDGVSRVLVNCRTNEDHQARYDCDDSDGASDDRKYFYTNDGRSDTQSATLELTNTRPLKLGDTQTTFTLALNWKDTENNRQSDDGYDERIEEELIYYKGRLISADDLPAWDYNIPFGTRLFTVTRIPAWHLQVSNFINLRRGGTIARDTGDDCDDDDIDYCEGEHDIYDDFDFDSLWTVDSEIVWTPQIWENGQGYLRVEIKNLFDDKVDTNARRLSTTTSRSYTSGRIFWAEWGINF